MSWYFASDLHLSHESIMRGWRGERFSSMRDHNETIMNNLLSVPKGSDLMIAGDLFWKFAPREIESFFTSFKKAGINVHIVYGNHDRLGWFKYSIIRSQGHMKNMTIQKQAITVSHYPMTVWDKSHYNAWNLFGHIHMGDETWKKLEHGHHGRVHGKQLNINIELHGYKPWSFDEIKSFMESRPDNWDKIERKGNK